MTEYSRTNPFPGHLLVNRSLGGPGSAKDTRHLEVSLDGSGFQFEPGDSMAVYPTNDPELVEEIIHALRATGDEEIARNGQPPATLREILVRHCGITQATPKFLKAIAADASAAPLLSELLADPERKAELDTYLYGMEVIDFLLEHPSVRFTAQEFVALLPKLQPRLYSIASSLKKFPHAVHFIIDVVKYKSHGRERKGVCSTYLAERCADSPVPIYPTVSKFRMPEDNDIPIIMVGPGTGVAPFRAFLQEREAIGARGKTWLFFGSQHEKTDFYYQEDFEAFIANKVLTRLDTAFSRDQAHKIYVQNRMLEASAELWKWLQDGAWFYVCGDAKRMAKDVDAALRQIVREEGGKSVEEANAYVETLKRDKRYRRDVY